MSMESPDCHPAQLLRPLYLEHKPNYCDAFVPQAGHLGLTQNPRSGAGWGEPRVWVGQPLIISRPVVTWQTELVSQAGLSTVSAAEAVQLSSVAVLVSPLSTGCVLGSHVAASRYPGRNEEE